MKALLKFCTIGSREVPQLVKMIGPEPSKFTGMSARVDELVEPIMARLASDQTDQKTKAQEMIDEVRPGSG